MGEVHSEEEAGVLHQGEVVEGCQSRNTWKACRAEAVEHSNREEHLGRPYQAQLRHNRDKPHTHKHLLRRVAEAELAGAKEQRH